MDPYEPLTESDIDDFSAMELTGLDMDLLEDLLSRAEELRDLMEDARPGDTDSEEYNLWEARLSEVDDFLDRIHDRMDVLDEG